MHCNATLCFVLKFALWASGEVDGMILACGLTAQASGLAGIRGAWFRALGLRMRTTI